MVFKNIEFPRLQCPFPEAINPLANDAHEHTLNWIRRFRLINDEKTFEHIRQSKFGRLAARAYPKAARDRLQIVSDWNTWLFILDDQCDECGLGKHPDQLSAVHNRCLEILCDKKPTAKDLPLIHALHDIYSRLQPISSQSWRTRFAKSAAEYFEATFWEAQNRYHKRWPDTASYVRMRPYTGGLYTDIELIEVTEEINLPCLVRSHPRLNQLISITNNVVCWSNDIISLKKEKLHGDMHNLVLIMQHESDLDLQEALNRVKLIIDNQIRRYQLFETQLPSFGRQIDGDVARFTSVLRSWMRGNLDWAYESERYDAVAGTRNVAKTLTFEKPVKKTWAISLARTGPTGEADMLAK